ncbi:MAG: EamA family transporter [Candidatus Riflebacteria bacterium]|jgi:drug/metabolite transporter (DMT)-like permease|nr:EamA family transporter [Candidatus Riflebacteria bacterium]
MTWLALSAICSLIIANILRYARQHDLPFLPIMTMNYLQAALVSVVLFVANDSINVTRFDFPLGALNSFLYVGGFLLYFEAVKNCGISIAVSVMRLSVALPVMAGVLWFGETLSFYQILGLLLMAVALISIGRFSRSMLSGKAMGWLFLLFLVIGSSSVIDKAYNFYGKTGQHFYLATLFFTAFLLAAIFTRLHRISFSGRVVKIGLLLGIPNQATSLFLLMALSSVDSVVAFPTLAISVLSGSMLCDRFIWGESFTREKVFLIVVSMVAIVLLNL